MPLLTKDEMKNTTGFNNGCYANPMKKMDHKAMVKHIWYINNRRGGDATPKTRGRPFFSKTAKEPVISDVPEERKDESILLTKGGVALTKCGVALTKETKPKPIKKKMTGVEKRRRTIALNLEKVNKRAEAFRQLLKE
jgi:hypothetical protein